MKKIVIVLLLISLLLISALYKATAAPSQSSQTLIQFIENEFKKTQFSGMSVEIVNETDILLSQTYGTVTSTNTPFITGSISKTFTAVAIMQLVENGTIDLDTPISAYLPKVNKKNKLTVKELLHHTSGAKTFANTNNYTLTKKEDRFIHADVNYSLLGEIIENVSGESFATYVEKNIFVPLGMKKSFTSLTEAQAYGMASGHQSFYGKMMYKNISHPTEIKGWRTLPTSYLIASTHDIGKFSQAFLTSNEKLLSPVMFDTMNSSWVAAGDGLEYGYGMWRNTNFSTPMHVSGSSVENYSSYMIIMPEKKIAVICNFDSADYFSGNELAEKLTYSIANIAANSIVTPIDSSAYTAIHTIINILYIVFIFLAFLPIFRLKTWKRILHKKTLKEQSIFLMVIHVLIPTVILALFPLLGVPIRVIIAYAFDVFIVQIITSLTLYITGIFKLRYLFYTLAEM